LNLEIKKSWCTKLGFFKVAKTSEVSLGKMIHVEVQGKEILIANVEGKFYAIEDRCGHMNARLSMGTLTNTIVICPQHFSRFDVTTGKLISEPKMMNSEVANIFAKCPEEVQKTMMQMAQHMAEIQGVIKTYDQSTYPVEVEGSSILVNV
jgi:nitrite reductase/ring-hydroxylating ferredoxin subunit